MLAEAGHEVLEEPAALGHVAELVEGRARRREEHGVARTGGRDGGVEGLAHVGRADDLNGRARGPAGLLDGAGDALARRAKADGGAAGAAHGRGEAGEVGHLVVPAQHDHDGAGPEGGEGLLHGVGVGGLGVVDKVDARVGAAGLDAVLDGVEVGKAARQCLVGGSQVQRARGGGVLPVVAAANLEGACGQELVLNAGRADDEHAVAHEGGVGGGGLALYGELAGGHAAGEKAVAHRAAPVVVHAHDGEVALAQVGEDLLLGGGVGLEGAVPLHVVGRHVQKRRHAGVEQPGGGQLEAGELRHEPAVGRTGGKLAGDDGADVAHGLGAHARDLQQVRGERGRGGLSVGARDGHPALGALAEGKLGLADDLPGARARRGEERGELRDSRGGHGQVIAAGHVLGAQDAPHARGL